MQTAKLALFVAVLATGSVEAVGCRRTTSSDATPTTVTDAASTNTTTGAAVAFQPEPDEAQKRREDLARSVGASGYVKTEKVLDAIRRVPRHLFVPDVPLEQAYGDFPLPIGLGQTISQPSVVGETTEALELTGSERVLEIGTGSGYQAAILSVLTREVYSIEIVRELGERAEKRLRELGYNNVHVRIGDGYRGWPEHAPFDRVVLTAAPPEVPKALIDQLAEGGILVAPVGEERATQWLVRMRKKNGKVTEERLDLVRFVPMVRGR